MKIDHILLEGASGKLGYVVVYQRYGKTLVRKAQGNYDKTPTHQQRHNREKFVAAHQFGQSVIRDPILKALYEKKAKGKCSAYNKAVSEFLRK